MNKQRLITPLIMWFIVLAGSVFCYFLLPERKIFSAGYFGWIILVISFIYWIWILSNGLTLHKQATFSVAKIDHLVVDGIYKLCRHPLYGADILMVFAIALNTGTIKAFAIGIWFAIVLVAWAKLEEVGLERKFGEQYASYKKRTPMFIPYFRN